MGRHSRPPIPPLSMLVLRDAQLRALRVPFHPLVTASLIAHARECHPAETDALGDGLEAFLQTVVERGEDYHIISVRDLSRYLSLVLVFGIDWQTPELRWMHDALIGPANGAPERLRKLFNRAVDRLAAEESADVGRADS